MIAKAPISLLIYLLAFLLNSKVLADGTGLIGWGKTMYDPPCAFACRAVIKACRLLCTPAPGGKNYGTAHSPIVTPPECFTTDNAFLRTMALCIDTYCPANGAPPMSKIDDYWASHLAVTTVGNYQWKPSFTFNEALEAARIDEEVSLEKTNHSTISRRQHSHTPSDGGQSSPQPTYTSSLPVIKAKAPLNVTSFVSEKDWRKQYNGLTSFEINENGHSTYTITVMLVALFLPVFLSLLQFIPGVRRNQTWTWINSLLSYPAAWGKRHREPTAAGLVIPTRGQMLYLLLISFLNVIFLVAPYYNIQPQSTFATLREQEVSTIGNRAGSMAMGNAVAIFVFSTRSNLLLHLTDWSHGTFLLLHRCLGYWVVLHTVLHSIMLLVNYCLFGHYDEERIRLYWAWGIVATIAIVAIVPSSLLIVRQKMYEFFLATHVVLALIFLVGYYYHIWYLYTWSWGYEIWV